jgi:hypothetical protein
MAKRVLGLGSASTKRAGRRSAISKRGAAEPDKVIRDSFTMPRGDYQLIAVLKQRCIGLGIAMNKSELLRAGLGTLERLPDAALTQALSMVESVKTGRPPGKKKGRKKKKKPRHNDKKR